MRIKQITLFIFFIALSFQSRAYTGDSLNYLTPRDTVFLELGEYGRKIFKHIVAPKQTLFSLAQFYNLSLNELYFYNAQYKNRPARVGDAIRVPIPNRAIIRFKDETINPRTHIPIYFVVSKGQTLYSISRNYFRMPLEVMKERNGLTEENLMEGQKLFVGWMSVEGVKPAERFLPDDEINFENNPILREHYELRNTYQEGLVVKEEWEHKGLTKVIRAGKMKSGFVVMHQYAPINSVIRIFNPSSKRSVYARVIGRIPDSLTEQNTTVILVTSPTIAQILGIIDNRFFAEVRYLK